MVVAAVAVALKVPYVIPVVFGLLGAPSFAVSMMLGTIVYYMLHTVKLTASAFQSGGVKELLDGIMVFTKQILANKEMWMMVVVLLLAMMVVYGCLLYTSGSDTQHSAGSNRSDGLAVLYRKIKLYTCNFRCVV